MPAPGEYLLINPAWGDTYLERFLKLSLPAQLSAGNIAALPRGRARYLLYTHERHFAAIRQADAFRALERLIPVSLLSLDDLPDPRSNPNPHELQSAAYNRGLRAGRGRDAAFLFLTPDVLIGDGAFERLVELCEGRGKRVITIASIRMCIEGAYECLEEHRRRGEVAVAIPNRSLVRLSLQDPHPISAGHMVKDGRVHAAQHHYWRINDGSILIRAFHLSPILVWPTAPDVAIRSTLDDDYVHRACPDTSAWYTATDSDEICQTEFSERQHKHWLVNFAPLTDAEMFNFLRWSTSPTHRELFRTPIRFHDGTATESHWRQVEAESAAYADDLLKRYKEWRLNPPAEAAAAVVNAPSAPAVEPAKNGLASWARRGYRVLAWPLYRYLDRLNAEIIGLRQEVEELKRRSAA
jgi:hypothetical protein